MFRTLIYILASSYLIACNNHRSSHTDPMRQYLIDSAINTFYNVDNKYANVLRERYYDSLFNNSSTNRKYKYLLLSAVEALNAGNTSVAIEKFKNLADLQKRVRYIDGLKDYEQSMILPYLGLSHLRMAEQQNCLLNHTSQSCILPVKDKGIHQLTEGSSNAINVFEQVLQYNSDEYTIQWLYNVAKMTLGQYHDSIEYYIPIEQDKNNNFPRFNDIAHQAGLDYNGLAGGVIVDDFNNDYNLDVVITEWHPEGQIRYFENTGAGVFEEKTIQAGLTGYTGGSNLVQADYDNDGNLDFFVVRGGWLYDFGNHPNSLFKNNGDGTFIDVTIEAGLLSFHPTQTATWNDFNQDGHLDLFIGNESSSEHDFNPCELYINRGNGTFEEVAFKAGVQVSNKKTSNYSYVKGVTSGDYDNDGWPDIYVSIFDYRKNNVLLRNTGVDTSGIPIFKDVTISAGLEDKFSSFPTWFWDYNNDGRFKVFHSQDKKNRNTADCYILGYTKGKGERSELFGSIAKDVAKEYLNIAHNAQVARLYKNHGNGTFVNVANKEGINKILYAMGANYGDLNNDGKLDMYLSTGEENLQSIIPNRMFIGYEQGFEEVTTPGGFGHIQKGHGVAFADLDNDGDQDVYSVMGGAYEGDNFWNVLFENPGFNNNYVSLLLQGSEANKSAIGSKIHIYFTDENDNQQMIFQEVNSGGSFGCNPLRQEIGLGQATKIDSIWIAWNGSDNYQVFKDVKINSFVKIEENKTTVEYLKIRPITWNNNAELIDITTCF